VLEQPAEWIVAGYCGDEIVYAWLCEVAVGLMALGKEDIDAPGRLVSKGAKDRP